MIKPYNVTKTLYKVSDFITFMRSNNLILSPIFQRRSVWSKGAKSYLIDTIIRGLPIPIIFLREQKSDLKSLEPKREVVDGQQRIRTVLSYITPSLLKDFNIERDEFVISRSHNRELANKKFSELDDDTKQRILDYEFSVHVFPAGVDDREILQIFTRMNSTSYELNPQELRNAKFFGEFKTSVYTLAAEQLNRWRYWKVFTEDNIARMNEVEFTSELVHFMFNGMSTKRKKGLDKIYEDKDKEYKERNEIERRFHIVMDSIEDIRGNELRFSPFKQKTWFYPFFAVIYDSHFGLNSSLAKKTTSKIPSSIIKSIKDAEELTKQRKAPEEILGLSGRRTTDAKTRKALFDFIKFGGRIGKGAKHSG